MCGPKHLEPFKCEVVPNDVVLLFCLQHKELMQLVHDGFADYLNHGVRAKGLTRKQRNKIGNDYYSSGSVQAFIALVLLCFNYKDSYLRTGSVVTRFVRVYRYEVLKINKWF